MNNPTTRQRNRKLKDRIHSVQESALGAIERKIADGQNSLGELTTLVKTLADMNLSAEWSKRLEKAILKNPSLLTSPVSKSGSLLEKVRTGAGRVFKDIRGDGRESRTKIRREAEGIPGRDFPFDEEPGS